MKKTWGICCIAIGTALLISALSIVLYNMSQDKSGGAAAKEILVELEKEIPETESSGNSEKSDLFSEYEATQQDEPTVEIGGQTYIGMISIPSLQLELPVLSQWSYPNLKLSPCRYKGTAAGGDLIVAAHNYRSHFGRISELNSGDEIIFTDADGKVYAYETIQTETIVGKDIASMEFGADEEWDISLFTCTLGGQSRVTVRAVLISDQG
ncbi:sortase [uncultured Ruminococcus sp.]|uniref:sortase n=1 Tax=uncultured Ruminococcus sp. TaxID=165186 RepID=UPI0025DCF3BE|nr:sortase [uncultured Ruminococcus sp.]